MFDYFVIIILIGPGLVLLNYETNIIPLITLKSQITNSRIYVMNPKSTKDACLRPKRLVGLLAAM